MYSLISSVAGLLREIEIKAASEQASEQRIKSDSAK